MMKEGIKHLNKIAYKLQLEKLIIGIEESIFIKGVGDILAKVDSGNGGYNVIHGEDIYYEGGTVIFTTFDERGQPHKISKKVQDTVNINIGAGHSEERPVVLFDVKFANDEFLNVPFSVGNRANNKNKVLLGKEFLTSELDALIDISQDNIASKEIEIDIPIIKEAAQDTGDNRILPTIGTKKNPSGSASTAKKVYQGTKGAIRGAYNMYKTLSNPNQSIGSAIDDLKKNWKDMREEMTDYQLSDKRIIFKMLNEYFTGKGIPIKPFIKNPQVFKILDYLGNDYGNNNNFETSEPELTSQDNNNQEETLDNSSVINIGDLILEKSAEFDKALKDVLKSNKPILYLVIFDGSKIDEVKSILSQSYEEFSGNFGDMMNNVVKNFYTSDTSALSNKITDRLKEADILASMVLVQGKNKDRKAEMLSTDLFVSKPLEFIKERPIDYKKPLGPNARDFEGTFYSNKQYGFHTWQQSNSDKGLPEVQIENWIRGEKNADVLAAFREFLGKGNYSKEGQNNNKSTPGETPDENYPETLTPTNQNNFGTDTKNKKLSPAKERADFNKKLPTGVKNELPYNDNNSGRTEPDEPQPQAPNPEGESKEFKARKVGKDFVQPSFAKKLKNDAWLWRDPKTKRLVVFVPHLSMVLDAQMYHKGDYKEFNNEEQEEFVFEMLILGLELDCFID